MIRITQDDLCEVFFGSHGIPIGIFDGSGNLRSIFSGFGQAQTGTYLKDSSAVMEKCSGKTGPLMVYGQNRAVWSLMMTGDRTVFLMGPVQTGESDSFTYEGIPELSMEIFRGIASSFFSLLTGSFTEVQWPEDASIEKTEAEMMLEADWQADGFRSFDEIYECVGTGDTRELTALLGSGEYIRYQDRVMKDRDTARTVYIFSLAKTYHTALGASVPISELSALVSIYLAELDRYASLASLKSGMHRMLYDFTRRVDQYRSNDYSPQISSAVMYIREHIHSRIYIEDIAKHCAMSVSALQHAFRAETGMPVTEMIVSLKMEKACYFLRYTALSCTDIAFRMGYSSQSYFIKQFRRIIGLTPSDYRRQPGEKMI